MSNTSYQHSFPVILLICGCILVSFHGVYADQQSISPDPAVITFKLVDTGENTILRASLMKEGEYSKNGQTRQDQQIQFVRETNEIIWNPCNDNSCSVTSLPTAGGTTGRDELILNVIMQNPSVDLSLCHGDTTCERLRGGIVTKSGMVDGFFYTGKTYTISIAGLQPGINQAFPVTEVTQ
ncbi:MAG TPA: hypothetical protein VN372_08870 [Methanospirillum sp.]|nr:hypothetical protein [Methanospirillum sp.]